ncbi:MAG: bacterial transcriptional activator domain-containing protein [Anaerolineae bacterium]
MADSPRIADLLQQGIAAAKAGRKEEARRLLTQVVDLDERNEKAWLWLSGVVESTEDRQICLENVLALNPDNQHARAGLEWLQQHAPPPPAAEPPAQAAVDDWEVAEAPEPPAAAPVDDQAAAETPAEAWTPTGVQTETPAETWAPAETPVETWTPTEARTETWEPATAPAEVWDPTEARREESAPVADDPAALLEAARHHLEAGDPQQAVELLTRLVALQPMNAEAYLRLGDAYRLTGGQAQAHRAYDNARKLTAETSGLGQEARHKLARMEQLPPDEMQRARARVARSNRPGCVTVYAILMALGGVMGILSACGVVAVAGTSLSQLEETLALQGDTLPISAGQLSTFLMLGGGLGLLFSGLNLAIAVGLWQMRNWARIAVIVLLGLGLLLGVAQAAVSILSLQEALAAFGMQGVPIWYLGGLLVGFVIQVYIIFWFVANREHFA